MIIALGLTAGLMSLLFQALTAAVALRILPYVVREESPNGEQRHTMLRLIFGLMILFLLLLLGILVQLTGWAILYRAMGGFADFETSLYFSGVTFTSLGYGDLVLPKDLRLLAPLEAAIGMLMLGVSTALFVGASQRFIALRRTILTDLE
jgi:Ion channel